MLTILFAGLLPVVTCTLQICSQRDDFSSTVPANDAVVKTNEVTMIKFLMVALMVFLLLLKESLLLYCNRF